MKRAIYAAVLSAAFPLGALAQTADEIKNAERTPQNVLTYGMSYNHQRYSTLTQISRDTVKRLVPAWLPAVKLHRASAPFPSLRLGMCQDPPHAGIGLLL